MNALRKPVLPVEPIPQRRVVPLHHRRRSPRRSYGLVVAEMTVKFTVNGILSAAALMALGNLFPYYWAQQARLQELKLEIRETEKEVSQLQSKVNRSFDPSQARTLMKEQSAMLAPNQRRVVLLNRQDANTP
ncbi:hypothetical protein K4A83_16290 [Spirulina subsalsa FACHB-351]|uniref:Cell division protein FtsL n=1 Tax=Spirulina subsalsa FACHB-351 TaxID=234711 RepID=A0ABT3L8K6_9CYAN|nr:hypothetical protein [Spirulina subsalsa]MCW6037819.1 hypothetical protein [Spirulina subsalsa FACHB-351]